MPPRKEVQRLWQRKLQADEESESPSTPVRRVAASKAGGKWSHGFVPRNAAARALKLKKKPKVKGSKSKRTRRS